jgi:sRNA-binding protein
MITNAARQDHNAVIQQLSELYPKCFFTNPKQRRPLKPNIVVDLFKAADRELAWFDVGAAVDWYISHIGYDYACMAGAGRVDLDGKVVGKVTESEAREAENRVAAKHQQMAEQRCQFDALKTAQALYGTGGMTDCQMRKIPAPPKKPGIYEWFRDATSALQGALKVVDDTDPNFAGGDDAYREYRQCLVETQGMVELLVRLAQRWGTLPTYHHLTSAEELT